LIRTEGLAKSFGSHPVLRGISLEVARGEVFGFVGPNGAGKSTFLKCLLGIVHPGGGTVSLDGVDAVGDPLEARRRCGYAPGEISLYNRMRVGAFLDFAVAFHAAADRRWGRELLAQFGLPLRARVGTLSHGMKRKLLLVQALIVKTPVLLLDEPMEGLDPEARRSVETLLRAQAAAGRTVFLSSHDLASVERACDRVAFLRAGRVLETGSVADLLGRAGKVLILLLKEPRTRGQLPEGPEIGAWNGSGTRWRLQFRGELAALLPRLAALPLAGIRDSGGRLEEVFETLYGPEAPASPYSKPSPEDG